MEQTFLIVAVVGFVELLRRLKASDWYAAATIIGAAVIGGLAGWGHVQGIADVWTGIVMGLSASGLVTVATRVTGYTIASK